jgi:hypothetical protein
MSQEHNHCLQTFTYFSLSRLCMTYWYSAIHLTTCNLDLSHCKVCAMNTKKYWFVDICYSYPTLTWRGTHNIILNNRKCINTILQVLSPWWNTYCYAKQTTKSLHIYIGDKLLQHFKRKSQQWLWWAAEACCVTPPRTEVRPMCVVCGLHLQPLSNPTT